MQTSVLVSALMLAWGAEAAGLGRLTVQSALGQPLRAEIELVAVQPDEIGSLSARLANAEAFRQARVERAEALSGLRFEIDKQANGQPVIKITSAAPINDPFLDLVVELNWNTGRLIRDYTLLLDPPADTRPKAETSQAPAVATPRTEGVAQVQPSAPAATETAPAKPTTPARYGPVKAGETLHAIAAKTRPAEVTLEQMMVGIYHQNRAAFHGNNMNRLKKGAVLNLPDRDTAMRVDPARASREVRAHASDWIAYRRRLAEAVAAAPAVVVPEAGAGRVTPAPERREPAPAAPAEDVLRLSKGEPGTTKALERIQSLEEELAAKGRALQEAQERVAELERTVKDMQRLLELKATEAAKPAPTEEAPAPAAAKPEAATPVPAPAPKATPPSAVSAPLPTPEPESSWLSTFI
ncbi:MAG: FimV family protein, partial [Thiobacillaceae bacterium]